MKTVLIFCLIAILPHVNILAQQSINSDGTPPDPSAGLEIKFTDKGLLPPRLNYFQIISIPDPAAGLLVYNTSMGALCVFNGYSWEKIGSLPDSYCLPVNYNGEVYSTVLLGIQCWLGRNLNVGTMIHSTAEQSNNGMIEKYCPENDPLNCNIYGGLYQWGETVQYLNGASNETNWNPVPNGVVQGICPSGWHIPNDMECAALADFLGGPMIAGSKMKEAGTVHWSPPNMGATNSSGFTMLPAGDRANGGGFFDFHYHGSIYSATSAGGIATYWNLYYLGTGFLSGGIPKVYGWSVRCVKD